MAGTVQQKTKRVDTRFQRIQLRVSEYSRQTRQRRVIT